MIVSRLYTPICPGEKTFFRPTETNPLPRSSYHAMPTATLRNTIIALLGLVMVGNCSVLLAEEAPPSSRPQPFAVVELFTSEGCSSCPPADKLLSELVADAQKTGKRIYPLAFHVDYWNYLGWTDAFSLPAFSQRQKRYADALHATQVYTPQMIVSGKEQFVGSDHVRAMRAIKVALENPATVDVTLRIAPDPLTVRYEVTNTPKGAVLHIALVERHLESKVTRGENAGRALRHENVVRVFETVRLDETNTGKVILNIPSSTKLDNVSVIGFVQDPKTMLILGATGTEVDSGQLDAK
jgi:hypothetical protein